ncbi:MAG: IclR family transcriptional regulator [Nostocoides sp.]
MSMGSQTLERGLDVLQRVIEADQPLSLAEIAARTGLHRSVAYRLVRSLNDRGLIVQRPGEGYGPGLALLQLIPRLRAAPTENARPILQRLAREVECSVVLSIRDGGRNACLLSVPPSVDGPFLRFREGAAGPLARGASSIALLALSPPQPEERAEVATARQQGPFAVVRTEGELCPGVVALATAWRGPPDVAISVVFLHGQIDEAIATRKLLNTASALRGAAQPGGTPPAPGSPGQL